MGLRFPWVVVVISHLRGGTYGKYGSSVCYHGFSVEPTWQLAGPSACQDPGLLPSRVISLTAWLPSVQSRAVCAQSIVRRFDRWLNHQRTWLRDIAAMIERGRRSQEIGEVLRRRSVRCSTISIGSAMVPSRTRAWAAPGG